MRGSVRGVPGDRHSYRVCARIELSGGKMIKVALIGIGHVARYQIEAMSNVDGLILTDAYDIDPSRAKNLPASVVFHETLQDLISNSKADIFLISTPNMTHFEIGMEVIEKGRSVLLEKPICTTQEELEMIIEASEKKGVFTSVAFHASFAQDVDWWLNNNNGNELGKLLGFNSGFFDPYITKGKVSPISKSLGGSWIDSGINALSVISKFIHPSTLKITEARMTSIEGIECQQVQGLSIFSFKNEGHCGHGVIDTNWSLNVNRKTTRLWYENADILLHHSLESVFRVEGDSAVLIKDLRNNNARLTNHYTSLFVQLTTDYTQGKQNIKHAAMIHELLFSAMSERDQYLVK
ncbi:MAG TPA: Gfo/Idh/MocA family oxidoreductase [Spirochaetes bacterium]|nr:Gfo/Idh/MocA family oxidoreductase [Spirochaetota bacterium]